MQKVFFTLTITFLGLLTLSACQIIDTMDNYFETLTTAPQQAQNAVNQIMEIDQQKVKMINKIPKSHTKTSTGSTLQKNPAPNLTNTQTDTTQTYNSIEQTTNAYNKAYEALDALENK